MLLLPCEPICKSDEYTIVTSNNSFVRCLTCLTCHPGRGLYPLCGKRIQDKSIIDCKDCPTEKFSSKLNSAPCNNCKQCAMHEIVTAPCTNSSDRVCSGTCKKGYFYSQKDSTHSCQKCSHCCYDGKDEEVTDCANQGLNASKQHCRPRPDKNCSPVLSPTDHASGTNASKTSGIIIGVISGVVLFIAVVLLIILFLYRRKKNQQVTSQGISLEEGNGRTSCK